MKDMNEVTPEQNAQADAYLTREQILMAKRRQQQADKMAILNHESPTEKYSMVYPVGSFSNPSENKMFKIYDGAQKLVGTFPVTPHFRKLFNGKLKITVKAKIIDGRFELIKVLG